MTLSGRFDEANTLGDAMIAHVNDDADPKNLALLAHALGVKGTALVGQGHLEEAIEILDALVARLENAPGLEVRAQIALGLNTKAMVLHQLGRESEAVSARSDLVTRYGEEALIVFDEHARHCDHSAEPQAREQLVSILYSKARVLADLGRPNDALPVLVSLISRFEGDENPKIQISVDGAREVRDQLIEHESSRQ
jgi:tetratricopeptide (TPR) repeat protein